MKTTSRFVSSCSFWSIILGLGAGCASKPDDAKISSDIQSKFSQDSGLSTKQLTVQASNGVVTLGGTVDNDAQREAASRQAASVPGVKKSSTICRSECDRLPHPRLSHRARRRASSAPPPTKPKAWRGQEVAQDQCFRRFQLRREFRRMIAECESR